MKERIIISSIEIEEILIEHFGSFDAILKIEDIVNENGEADQMIYAEIVHE